MDYNDNKINTSLNNSTRTIGVIPQLKELDKKLYTPNEIKDYDLTEYINEHPLVRKPTYIRSKLAYKELFNNIKQTNKYILPGQIALFTYANPKYGETLPYYDMTPFVLSFGLFKLSTGEIREVGLNLHYYPPFTRARILNSVYRTFKPYFDKQFNDELHKPNTIISYQRLRHIIKTNSKIAFGVKEYIPVLRSNTMIIPTRLLSTAFYTEGHFSKATLQQIFQFWRKFNRFS